MLTSGKQGAEGSGPRVLGVESFLCRGLSSAAGRGTELNSTPSGLILIVEQVTLLDGYCMAS